MQSGTWIEGAEHLAGSIRPVKGMGSGSDGGQGWNARPPCLVLGPWTRVLLACPGAPP